MRRAAKLGALVLPAAILVSGCGMFKKESYMVPTPQGWVEMQSKDGGNKLKYKPAENVQVQYK